MCHMWHLNILLLLVGCLFVKVCNEYICIEQKKRVIFQWISIPSRKKIGNWIQILVSILYTCLCLFVCLFCSVNSNCFCCCCWMMMYCWYSMSTLLFFSPITCLRDVFVPFSLSLFLWSFDWSVWKTLNFDPFCCRCFCCFFFAMMFRIFFENNYYSPS